MSFRCFHCFETGHRHEECPLRVPAASEAEHLARIDTYVSLWHDGLITREAKRIAISTENIMWHGADCRAALRYVH
jgi:hypothetical protein